MNSVRFIPLLAAVILSLSFVIAPFTGRFRKASLWLRSALLTAGLLICTWSVLGLLDVFHTRVLARLLFQLRGDIGGVGVGILAAVATSPEFRTCTRRKRGV
jgi:hypothetical protein